MLFASLRSTVPKTKRISNILGEPKVKRILNLWDALRETALKVPFLSKIKATEGLERRNSQSKFTWRLFSHIEGVT